QLWQDQHPNPMGAWRAIAKSRSSQDLLCSQSPYGLRDDSPITIMVVYLFVLQSRFAKNPQKWYSFGACWR
ncbi:MAG: hypothetical protein ACUVR7_15545, partial [Armatimonadota bacterium]